jgi:hypothetical protein
METHKENPQVSSELASTQSSGFCRSGGEVLGLEPKKFNLNMAKCVNFFLDNGK